MANEFKIISEDGLKMLCKAIKKVSTIGEIIDDVNSVTDKTYSSFEIDRRLNTKIDKTQLTAVLDETVTDEQIPGAKVVVDELGLKANDSEVVKKTDIATSIDSTSTDDEVPSAKAVYDNAIKDKRLKTYTSFEQLGISIANLSSSSLSDIGTRMEEGSSFNVLIRSDVKDIAYNAGIIPINDVGILSCIRLVGHFKVTFSHDKGGTGRNVSEFMTFSHNISTQSTFVWKKLCTTTVADVSKTEYSLDTSCDGVYEKGDKSVNNCWYAIRNGWCIVEFDLRCLQIMAGYKCVFTSLPKPIATMANVFMSNDKEINVGDKPLIIIIGTDGMMKAEGGKLDCRYIGTFSYPVAE